MPQQLNLAEARPLPTPRVSLGVSSNPIVLDEEESPPKGEKKLPQEASVAQRKTASLFNAKLKEALGDDIEKFRDLLRNFKSRAIPLEDLFWGVKQLFDDHNTPTSMLGEMQAFIPEKYTLRCKLFSSL